MFYSDNLHNTLCDVALTKPEGLGSPHQLHFKFLDPTSNEVYVQAIESF